MLEPHATQLATLEAGDVTLAAAITVGLWLWIGAVWLGLRFARWLLPRKRPEGVVGQFESRVT